MSPSRTFGLGLIVTLFLGAQAGCGNKEAKHGDGAYKHKEMAAGSGSAFTAEAMVGPIKGDHVASARILVEDLGKGDFAGALTIGNADVKAAFDAKKLEAAWKAAVGDVGAYVRVDFASVEPMEAGKERVRVRAKLAKGTIDAFVSFDVGKDEATGVAVTKAWTYPEGIDLYKLEDRQVVIGDKEKALPGTLTKPKQTVLSQGKTVLRPGVLLVHGEGPGDRDESLAGGARPFRDLALGLASKGLMVLAFEKRTYAGHAVAAGMTSENATLKQEYLDDVLAAAAVLRATEGVDPTRIFVVGHGQGGWLVPLFFSADPQIAGGVLLAGNARSLEDVLVPEAEQLAALPGAKIDKNAVAELKKKVERAKDKALTAKTPAADLPLGLGAEYWRDVRRYDAVAVAKKIRRPMMFLQGGRDYRVTEALDLAVWKAALDGRTDVRFEVYPKLNHAFFAGEGAIAPDEYANVLGHVDAKVVDDIATFVLPPVAEK